MFQAFYYLGNNDLTLEKRISSNFTNIQEILSFTYAIDKKINIIILHDSKDTERQECLYNCTELVGANLAIVMCIQNVHDTFVTFSKKIIREVDNNKRGKGEEGRGREAGRQMPNRKIVKYFRICKMEYYAMIRNYFCKL